jgi:hypothetical protein
VRKIVVAVGLCAALLAVACSVDEATSNVGTLDAPAVKACREVRAVIQARSAGGLATGDLRAQLAAAYDDAQASANPILRARAVALFVDATEIASGGEGHSLSSDLAAMDRTCSGSGG